LRQPQPNEAEGKEEEGEMTTPGKKRKKKNWPLSPPNTII